MKNSIAASSLLLAAAVLLAANALAQTDHPQAPNELSGSIAAARCPYAPGDTGCAGATSPDQAPRKANEETILAQLPRRGPGPAFRPRGRMGAPAYPQMWQYQPSGRHALIGAVIGGLLGWAVASKGTADARATLGIATLGAGLGGAMGLAVPSFPSRNPCWRRWPDDDEDASIRKSAKPGRSAPGSAQQTASVDLVQSNPGSAADADSSNTTAP